MSKIKNGGLDQYGAEPFEQQQIGTAGIEWVKTVQNYCTWNVVSATAGECDGRSSSSSSSSSFVVADRCVDVITDVTTYFKARALCRARGPAADLVQLKTEADNAQAVAALRAYLNSTETQAPNAFWIGLVRSRWSWESGQSYMHILICTVRISKAE